MAGQYVDSVNESLSLMASRTDPENGQPLQPGAAARHLPVQMSPPPSVDQLEKVLAQIRSDSVYELRRLQHHHRPVTGFDSKPTLEELLEKRRMAPPPAELPTAAAGEEGEGGSEVDRRVRHFVSVTTAAEADEQQRHMPAAVRLEIRGLIERQQVREVLNSGRAGEIERALHDGLERREQEELRRQRRRRQRARPPRDGGRQSTTEDGAVGARPPLRQPENGQAYPMPQRDQSGIVRQLQASPALGSLGLAERERIVNEVDQLVQQHLVTSTLSGEFRGVLELHIQNRADQVRDGVTLEDIRRSLQRRTEYTASTARPADPDAPSSAAVAELREELREMRCQVLELKQLMRTSFDLQLEIQRAIRQEVAATLNTPPSPSSSRRLPPRFSGVPGPPVVVESGNCVICSEASITSVIYRCGHMCVCMQCGLELKAQGLKCPICRAPITDIIRAYSSMQ